MTRYALLLLVCAHLFYAASGDHKHHFIQGECDEDWYQCENGTTVHDSEFRCIMKSWICDSGIDCDDGSDEKYCPYSFDSDESAEIEANPDLSPKRSSVFNIVRGLSSAIDKTNKQSFRFMKGICPTGAFMCERGPSIIGLGSNSYNPCVLKNWICDNDADCLDLSDEKYCPYDFDLEPLQTLGSVLSTALNRPGATSHRFIQGECPIGWFKCEVQVPSGNVNSTNCVRKDWICDDDFDCRDKSDEKYCPYNFDDDQPAVTPTQTIPVQNNPTDLNEADAFSTKVKLKMMKLSSSTYLHAERLINQVLYQAQIGNLTSFTQLHFCGK